MIGLPASVRVYLCLTPCEMRRSFDGLHALVRHHLQLDAFAGFGVNTDNSHHVTMWCC
jgi:transposase